MNIAMRGRQFPIIARTAWPATLALAVMLGAAGGFADDGPEHRLRWEWPVPLGVSGGNLNDVSLTFCCSGTLGALVRDGEGKFYVLSNNHVIARTNRGEIGDPITQPGLIDANCSLRPPDAVAHLSRFQRIRFGKNKVNRVDAAIGEILEGAVDPTGMILDIGEVGAETLAPQVGMRVKKSGRSTGLTTGRISAVQVTARVAYESPCGGRTRWAWFRGQFVVESSTAAAFVEGGDSGALVVERTANCPRPVGLLFSGNDDGSLGLVNPIRRVLRVMTNRLGGSTVSLVGCDGVAETARLDDDEEAAGVLGVGEEAFAAALGAQQKAEPDLFSRPGVVAVGIGRSETDRRQPVMVIYVERGRDGGLQAFPAALHGVPVRVVETGPFRVRGGG
jgi:hypothetical protein